MSITPEQENARMLARLLGTDEDEGARRLDQSLTITSYGKEAATFASELATQLGRVIEVRPQGEEAQIEVAVGGPALGRSNQTFHVLIKSDRVEVSAAACDPVVEPLHGLQRLIAACYAAAAILGTLIPELPNASTANPFVVRFAALGATRDVVETPIELDDAVLVGAGAVGNAFLRAARHLNTAGSLTVCDPKGVGSGNPNRCIYFTAKDVGKPKAPRLCANAQPDFPALHLTPFVGTFADLRAQKGRIGCVIVATDSRLTRRHIEGELPFEVIDASTTGATEVIVHSHGSPNPDACLGCIYPHTPDELGLAKDIASGLGVPLEIVAKGGLITADIAAMIASKNPGLQAADIEGKAFDTMFKSLCAQQALLAPGGEQVLAPFAFVSSLAGALQALELARFVSGVRFKDGKNYLFANAWTPPHARLRLYRPKLATCEICGEENHDMAVQTVWSDRLSA